MDMQEYRPGSAFSGVIGRTVEELSPAWPEPMRAREGAPTVLFVVLDGTGFAQLGCYGSPIATPNIDRLADNGLRLQHAHHRTLPADAYLHSHWPQPPFERNGLHHRSYDGLSRVERKLPFKNGFLSEMLLDHGYTTYAIGK